mmetsp:Transcript_6588/g.13819  ORF Transcript_6588/g.13819 Transcript_6588/m.13819 type:complete len:96 (-) Transcript_6588:1510-1797(-)
MQYRWSMAQRELPLSHTMSAIISCRRSLHPTPPHYQNLALKTLATNPSSGLKLTFYHHLGRFHITIIALAATASLSSFQACAPKSSRLISGVIFG